MIGGILVAAPHLMVVATTFIMLQLKSENEISKALFSIPYGVFLDVIYLTLWKYMPKILTKILNCMKFNEFAKMAFQGFDKTNLTFIKQFQYITFLIFVAFISLVKKKCLCMLYV